MNLQPSWAQPFGKDPIWDSLKSIKLKHNPCILILYLNKVVEWNVDLQVCLGVFCLVLGVNLPLIKVSPNENVCHSAWQIRKRHDAVQLRNSKLRATNYKLYPFIQTTDEVPGKDINQFKAIFNSASKSILQKISKIHWHAWGKKLIWSILQRGGEMSGKSWKMLQAEETCPTEWKLC